MDIKSHCYACKKITLSWHNQCKNPILWSKTNHLQIHIWPVAKIWGWSNTEQAPPSTRYWPAGYRRNRKEGMILSRFHIGHTHITHSYLQKRDGTQIWSTRKVPLTVKHILINYDRFRQTHPKNFQRSHLKDLLKVPNQKDILIFWKETKLFIEILPNTIKHVIKKPIPQILKRTKGKTNLTLSDIKWPTEVDMPLNKAQTQIGCLFKIELFWLLIV